MLKSEFSVSLFAISYVSIFLMIEKITHTGAKKLLKQFENIRGKKKDSLYPFRKCHQGEHKRTKFEHIFVSF